MEQFKTADEILDFAIRNEEEANVFYTELASKMDKPWMKKVFEGFAKEELGHREKLLKIKEGKRLVPASQQVQDLKMADYLADVEPRDDMDYQEALVVAMKKEKAAFRLYMDLAAMAEEPELAALLTMMAQEEAKHKLRFEIEYEDNFMDSKY